MKRNIRFIILAFIITQLIFNAFAYKLDDFNAKIRNYLVHRKFEKIVVTDNGIPQILNPRLGLITSPFYVIHYGLSYSESCKKSEYSDAYHWLDDKTMKYWPRPEKISLNYFKNSLNWVVDNISYDYNGLAHFLYDFDWPYENYEKKTIKAPWWSGLTDGYAIILLLRGYDCFNDEKYLNLAKSLYESVITPVEKGGSLIFWDGFPWIEEYVDPTGNPYKLPRVLNGMFYAYIGIKSYEEFAKKHNLKNYNLSNKLGLSILHHIQKFDMGLWSYYDAIGGKANLKYHRINWALITKEKRTELDFSIKMKIFWGLGVYIPFFYLIFGPISIAYVHMWMTFLLIWLALTLFLKFLTTRLNKHV